MLRYKLTIIYGDNNLRGSTVKKIIILINVIFSLIFIAGCTNNDIVLNIDKISKKVAYEKHRFTGFVRFKEVNNVLYSSIEPDFNILPIIANHFKNRLANEYFIIHDIKRNLAIVYDKNDYYLTSLSKSQKDKLLNAKDSGQYEALWKQYFKSTNIKERENLRLQSRMMPKRYRHNMVEVKESK